MVEHEVMDHVNVGEQVIDALVFSLAAYESSPDKVLSVLKSKYNLPGQALDVLSLPGFPSFSPHCHHDSSSQQPSAIIAGRSTHGHVVIAWRGTSDAWDVVQDLKILPRSIEGVSYGTAHMGFAERAESVPLEPLLRLLSAGERIILTGHSLGGAVSSLVTLRLLEAAQRLGVSIREGQVACVTFGAPLFASPSLADAINDKYRDIFFHIIVKQDFVPRIVPLVFLFQRLMGISSAQQEVLEAARFGRMVLDVVSHVTQLPISQFLGFFYQRVPPFAQLLLGGAVRLLWPSRSALEYSFAGTYVFVDPASERPEAAVEMAQAEDLSGLMKEAGFALTVNLDIIRHHLLDTYHVGLAKGLKPRQLARLAAGGAAAMAAAAVSAASGRRGQARICPACVDSRGHGPEGLQVRGRERLWDMVDSGLAFEQAHSPDSVTNNSACTCKQAGGGGGKGDSLSQDSRQPCADCPTCVRCVCGNRRPQSPAGSLKPSRTLSVRRRVHRSIGWFLGTAFRLSLRLRTLSTVSLIVSLARFALKSPVL